MMKGGGKKEKKEAGQIDLASLSGKLEDTPQYNIT